MNNTHNSYSFNKFSIIKIYEKCKKEIVDFSTSDDHSNKAVVIATILFMVSTLMLIGLLFLTVDTTSIKPIVETHQIGCI